MDVAKYLCERGGERLLMLTNNVSAVHMLCVACRMHHSLAFVTIHACIKWDVKCMYDRCV